MDDFIRQIVTMSREAAIVERAGRGNAYTHIELTQEQWDTLQASEIALMLKTSVGVEPSQCNGLPIVIKGTRAAALFEYKRHSRALRLD